MIEPPLGSILFSPTVTFNMSLRAGISYKIEVTDSQHSLPSPNPRAIPSTLLQPEPSSRMLVYFEVNYESKLPFSNNFFLGN